eukprot:1094473-Pelagomonas_calceolata.AAC.6
MKDEKIRREYAHTLSTIYASHFRTYLNSMEKMQSAAALQVRACVHEGVDGMSVSACLCVLSGVSVRACDTRVPLQGDMLGSTTEHSSTASSMLSLITSGTTGRGATGSRPTTVRECIAIRVQQAHTHRLTQAQGRKTVRECTALGVQQTLTQADMAVGAYTGAHSRMSVTGSRPTTRTAQTIGAHTKADMTIGTPHIAIGAYTDIHSHKGATGSRPTTVRERKAIRGGLAWPVEGAEWLLEGAHSHGGASDTLTYFTNIVERATRPPCSCPPHPNPDPQNALHLQEHVFALGNRVEVLEQLDAPAVVPHMADAQGRRFLYEAIFRWVH